MPKNPEFHFLFLDVPHLIKKVDGFPKLMLYLSHDKGRKTPPNQKEGFHYEERFHHQTPQRLLHRKAHRTERGPGVAQDQKGCRQTEEGVDGGVIRHPPSFVRCRPSKKFLRSFIQFAIISIEKERRFSHEHEICHQVPCRHR